MFNSDNKYTNRYGVKYWFEKLSSTAYQFVMEDNSFKHSRMGGRSGKSDIDFNDLGMFDPSGGPYITLGTKVDDRPIVRIGCVDDEYIVEVEN